MFVSLTSGSRAEEATLLGRRDGMLPILLGGPCTGDAMGRFWPNRWIVQQRRGIRPQAVQVIDTLGTRRVSPQGGAAEFDDSDVMRFAAPPICLIP
jgi:hypothetical protein